MLGAEEEVKKKKVTTVEWTEKETEDILGYKEKPGQQCPHAVIFALGKARIQNLHVLIRYGEILSI